MFNCGRPTVHTCRPGNLPPVKRSSGVALTAVSVGAGGSHSAESEQISIERVVLPSEIAGLSDRRGFLKLAGDGPIVRVEIPIPPARAVVCPPFVAATATGVPAPEPLAPTAVGSSAVAEQAERTRS